MRMTEKQYKYYAKKYEFEPRTKEEIKNYKKEILAMLTKTRTVIIFHPYYNDNWDHVSSKLFKIAIPVQEGNHMKLYSLSPRFMLMNKFIAYGKYNSRYSDRWEFHYCDVLGSNRAYEIYQNLLFWLYEDYFVDKSYTELALAVRELEKMVKLQNI